MSEKTGTKIKITMVNCSTAMMPMKAHESDAAFDVKSRVDTIIEPGKTSIVPLGFKIELPIEENYIWEAQIRPRSGLAAKNGIMVKNSPGTIDASYRGEVGCIVYNVSEEPFKITAGDRIAQMVITNIPKSTLEVTDSLSETVRGDGGFGSTGVK